MSGEYCVRFSSLNSDELIVVLVRALRRRVDDDDDVRGRRIEIERGERDERERARVGVADG